MLTSELSTTRRVRVTLRWKDGTGSRSTVEQLSFTKAIWRCLYNLC